MAVGDVARPGLVGLRGHELAIEHVVGHGQTVFAVSDVDELASPTGPARLCVTKPSRVRKRKISSNSRLFQTSRLIINGFASGLDRLTVRFIALIRRFGGHRRRRLNRWRRNDHRLAGEVIV